MSGNSGPSVGQPTLSRGEHRSLEIFISYRREDGAAHAGRLHDALVSRFGDDSVFMDVDSIAPGEDFTQVIDRAVGHCDVLIALIGPHWVDASNVRGRRLDDPQDLVRLEIQTALSRGIRVIPTLVGGARMPDAEELPGELASLTKRNAVELTHARFMSDLQLLVKPLEKIAEEKGLSQPGLRPATAQPAIGQPTPSPKPPQTRSPRRVSPQLVAAIVALVLLIGIGGWVGLTRSGANKILPQTSVAATWPSGYVGTWRGTGHEFTPPADFAITMTLKDGKIGQQVGVIDRPTLGCSANLILDKATTQAITLTEQLSAGYCNAGGQDITGTKIVATRNAAGLDWKEYRGDPASNPVAAAATLSEGTSGPIPGTTTVVAVPDGFLGTWRGTGHVSIPPDDFAITMIIRAGEIGQSVGTIDRPTLGCSSSLTLDKATAQSITLTQQLTVGYCNTGGQDVTGKKIGLSLGNGVLTWNEYREDTSGASATATAALTQASGGGIPGTSNQIAVPDGFVRTWKGTGREFTPSGDFAITMIVRPGVVGETVATLDRATIGCQAELILDRATTEDLTLSEHLTSGYCSVGGQDVTGKKIVLTLNGASLDWKEYNGDPSSTNATAAAMLASS